MGFLSSLLSYCTLLIDNAITLHSNLSIGSDVTDILDAHRLHMNAIQ